MTFTKAIIFLLSFFALISSQEWYEQNNPAFLTPDNFTSLVQLDDSSYKIVTFFTPSCRYCRLLKQVQQNLRREKEWNFKFYHLNCQLYVNLCNSKVYISSFPHIGIYSPFGILESEVHGYYPIEQIKKVYESIEKKDHIYSQFIRKAVQKEMKKQLISISDQQVAKIPQKNYEQVNPAIVVNTTQQKQCQITKQITNIVNKDDSKIDEKSDKSLQSQDQKPKTQIFKIALILLGLVAAELQLRPFIQRQQKQKSNQLRSVLQIPIPSEQTSNEKYINTNEQSSLLSE